MTNAVTIWSTVTNAIATRRTITGWTEPEGDNPAEPIYSDPVPLERLREGKWRRPNWTPEQRANPHANGATNFEAGERILDVVNVMPGLGQYDRHGAMGEGVPDLEAGTMTYTWAKVSGAPFDADTHHAPVWNGSSWNAPVAKTLAARKAEIKTAATKKFRAVRDGGTAVTIGGQSVLVATVHEAAVELDNAAAEITANGGPMKVVTRSKVTVPLTVTIAGDMLAAIRAHVRVAQETEAALYDAVDDAADHDALDLINVEAGTIDGAGGWPA